VLLNYFDVFETFIFLHYSTALYLCEKYLKLHIKTRMKFVQIGTFSHKMRHDEKRSHFPLARKAIQAIRTTHSGWQQMAFIHFGRAAIPIYANIHTHDVFVCVFWFRVSSSGLCIQRSIRRRVYLLFTYIYTEQHKWRA